MHQEVNHPLLQHKLTLLRDKSTDKLTFKALVDEISLLLAYEATKQLPLTTRSIETPLMPMKSPVIAGKKPVVVPILRAGLGMVDAFLRLMPGARVGHIGLYRDEETHQPNSYYFKIPKHSEQRQFYVCDPMLATGGSAVAAIDMLKANGIDQITFICIVAAPEGIKTLETAHPEVPIITASIDQGLNDDCYILPGLGDAGDRLFGTR